MAITRRTLLKYGLAGTALLTVGGVGLGLQGTVPRRPRGPLRALDPTSFSILAAVADRLDPGGEGLPSAWELRVPEKVDALLATSAPALTGEVTQVLALVENALVGLLFDGRPRTFTASPPQVQDAVLDNMRTSRIGARRTMFRALRGLCASCYWSDPRVWAHVGYPGPILVGGPVPEASEPQGVGGPESEAPEPQGVGGPEPEAPDPPQTPDPETP